MQETAYDHALLAIYLAATRFGCAATEDISLPMLHEGVCAGSRESRARRKSSSPRTYSTSLPQKRPVTVATIWEVSEKATPEREPRTYSPGLPKDSTVMVPLFAVDRNGSASAETVAMNQPVSGGGIVNSCPLPKANVPVDWPANTTRSEGFGGVAASPVESETHSLTVPCAPKEWT